ncbi:MAG: HD domain-containing protein [Ancrocorticia sp.]|uniref:[protein-PII] uridylyltransferase family protein n=1 Tax=Ancrocorticia sp. TaxID=2593684 RepID=UPI003F901213
MPSSGPLSGLREARQGFTPGAASRRRWSEEIEQALGGLWQEALAGQGVHGPISGIGLAAVGSLARRDAGPQSDLDLVLVHDGGAHPELEGGLEGLSNSLWYPIWDANLELDHSVRSLKDCRGIAKKDLAASMSLLDLRVIAGDNELVDRAASAVLADWRAGARLRFDEVVAEQSERRAQFGRLAYLIEGNLKEAAGGMRDALLIKAVVAAWLAERPSINYDGAYEFLLDVRDALTSVTGRHHNVLRLQYQDEVAQILGFDGIGGTDPADELLAEVSRAARTIRAAYTDVKRRARGSLETAGRRRGPRLVRGRALPPRLKEVAPGVGELGGELVLTSGASPADPQVLFALAGEAAQSGTPIRLASLAHMYRSGAGTAVAESAPWPEWGRRSFERILSSGRNQISVWEALDTAGLLTQMIPPWAEIRNLPQRSAIHKHTVDRHQFEVASIVPDMESIDGQSLAALSPERRSAVLVAAFFHDIGKRPGFPHHAQRGATMIPGILEPMGYPESLRDDVTLLTRHHLLLGDLATSEDPHDPATWATLSDAVGGDAELLICLHLLTQADASSCKPEAWGPWKASLVRQLVNEGYVHMRHGA